MATQLRRLYDEEISFSKFYAATKKEWESLSGHLWQRWPLPPGVTRDDVEQEMILAVWVNLSKWDSTKATLEKFIIYAACYRSKKWIHKQRGANLHGNEGKNKSRFPRSFTALARRSEPEESLNHRIEIMIGGYEADQEARVDFGTLLQLIPLRCRSERGQEAIRHLLESNGDAEAAGEKWFADRDARFKFQLGGEQEASSIVNSELRRLQKSLVNAA